MIKINGVTSNRQYYGRIPVFDYKRAMHRFEPLTFTNTSEGTQCISVFEHEDYKDSLVYSLDGGTTWQQISQWSDNDDGGTYTGYIYVNSGGTAMFKTTVNHDPDWDYSYYNTRFGNGWGEGTFTVRGNPLSLHYTNYWNVFAYKDYEFHNLFFEFTGLTSAEGLVLDCDTVPDYCFERMFMWCYDLVTPPLIPATTIGAYGYHSMFENTGLTATPVIQNVSYTNGSFNAMFCDCHNLTQFTCLIEGDFTDLENEITNYWTRGVASEGTFYKSSNATYIMDSMDGIPEGWTVVDAS